MVAKTITRKKNPEIVKEGFLNLLKESDTMEELQFNIHNMIDQRDVVNIIIHYEEIIRTGNKRNKKIQGPMLKKFKDKEGFI